MRKWSCLSTAGGTSPLGYSHARQPRQTPSRGGKPGVDVAFPLLSLDAHPDCQDHNVEDLIRNPAPHTAMQKLRIVTVGSSGGRSLTRPLRDARGFPSTRL